MSQKRAEDVVKACETEVNFQKRELAKIQTALAKAEGDLHAARVTLKYALTRKANNLDTES